MNKFIDFIILHIIIYYSKSQFNIRHSQIVWALN